MKYHGKRNFTANPIVPNFSFEGDRLYCVLYSQVNLHFEILLLHVDTTGTCNMLYLSVNWKR